MTSRGCANYLGLDYLPVGLWNFNGVARDLSGSGNDLVLEAGSARWTSLLPGVTAWCGDGSSNWINSGVTPALAITGDLTISALCSRFSSGSLKTLVSFGSATADAAHNYLYDLQAQTDDRSSISHMTGTRTNVPFVTIGCLPLVTPVLVTAVRQNNAYSVYLNGTLYAFSGPLTAPSGGASSNIRVGSSDSSSERWLGAVASVKINNFALSAGQVVDEYNRTLGPVFGTK